MSLEVGALLIADEFGNAAFKPEEASLFFQLVFTRYEHASIVPTSNLPFVRWGAWRGDHAVAAVTTVRIVHHAKALTIKADNYRLTDSKPAPPGEQFEKKVQSPQDRGPPFTD